MLRRNAFPCRRLFLSTLPPPVPRVHTVDDVGTKVLDDKGRLFVELGLSTYSEQEMRAAHSVALKSVEVQELARKVGLKVGENEDEFANELRIVAERLDRRLYPIALSFLFAGISIGAIIPILPALAATVQISPLMYSFVVSSFAASRLLGNVLASSWSETKGRKFIVVSGLFVCSGAIAAVGATPAVALFGGAAAAGAWLISCRIASGFGVALFQTGSLILLSR